MLKQVEYGCFQGRYWRGIALFPVNRQWRINFRTDFSVKDEIKEFCQARGGNWDAVERCWYVPFSNSHLKDGSVKRWLAEGIELFGSGMKIGADIEWLITPNAPANLEKGFQKLFQKLNRPVLTVLGGGEEKETPTIPEQVCNALNLSLPLRQLFFRAYENKQDPAELGKVVENFYGSIKDAHNIAYGLVVAYFLDGSHPDELDAFVAASEVPALASLIAGKTPSCEWTEEDERNFNGQ
jgi:hypothetical protein